MMSSLPDGQVVENHLRLGLGPEAADHFDRHRESREPIAERFQVLKGEHRRRRKKRDLLPIHDDLERRPHRHFRLAVSDVAAEQPIHRRWHFHVSLDVSNRRRLIGRQLVRKRALELLLPVCICREGVPRHGFALGVELQELFGHVAHRLLDARLRLLPRRPAQAIERGAGAAGEFLNQVETFDGDEQLVVAVVAKLQKLLQLRVCGGRSRPAGPQLLQANELTNPMIDVNDEIADLQVAQVGEKRLGQAAPLLPGRSFLFEDIRLGVDLQSRGGEAEAAREGADRHQYGCRVGVSVFHGHRDNLVLPKDLDGALRAAGAVSDEEHRVAALPRLANVSDPVADAATELHRGLTRDLVNAGLVFERELFETSTLRRPVLDLGPLRKRLLNGHGGDVSACRRIARAVLELFANLQRLLLHLFVLGDDEMKTPRRGQEIDEANQLVIESLAGRHDMDLVRRTGRPLRRRIEAAQTLHGVADELDADRLGVSRRKHVDDAAANGERAVLVNRVFA